MRLINSRVLLLSLFRLSLSLVWISSLPGSSAHEVFPSTHPLHCCQDGICKTQLSSGHCPPQKTLMGFSHLQNKSSNDLVYSIQDIPKLHTGLVSLGNTLTLAPKSQLKWPRAKCVAFSSLITMFTPFFQPRLPFLFFIYQNPTHPLRLKQSLTSL